MADPRAGDQVEHSLQQTVARAQDRDEAELLARQLLDAVARLRPGDRDALSAVTALEAAPTHVRKEATAARLALKKAGANFFFVATPEEGLALRTTLPDAHIFVLNGLPPGSATHFAEQRLMPVLNSLSELDQWLQLCLQREESVPAALHFDTGMNRLGFRLQDASIVKSKMDETGYLPQMVMSHLACADVPGHEKNRTQRAIFQSLLTHFPHIPASLANSAGTLGGRENHFQMVRPGIALYGGRAINGRPNPMTQAVTVEMPILQVREARTGETVGYGATYQLTRESRLATIGVGYADGLLRHLSGSNTMPGGKVAINGRLVPILGRVSMDLITLDVTDADCAPGDMVEILGPNQSIDDLARAAGTIGHEILTSLGSRYSRTYGS